MTHHQLALNPDVESPKDFFQYYGGRFLGYRPKGEGLVFPCTLADRLARGHPEPKDIPFRAWDSQENELVFEKPFKELRHSTEFLYGAPVLGNAEFGDTYVHVSGFAVRESIKGLSLGRLQLTVPNAKFYLNKYSVGVDEKYINAIQGRMGMKHEAWVVHNIYNKKFFGWAESLAKLNNGDRLGCQLTKSLGLFLDENEPNINVTYKAIKVGKVRDSHTIELLPKFRYLGPAIETAAKSLGFIGVV